MRRKIGPGPGPGEKSDRVPDPVRPGPGEKSDRVRDRVPDPVRPVPRDTEENIGQGPESVPQEMSVEIKNRGKSDRVRNQQNRTGSRTRSDPSP